MDTKLRPVPPDRVALTGVSWHQGCDILNPSSPHFRILKTTGLKTTGRPACDIILSVSQQQIDAACPIVISIKGLLHSGAVILSIVDSNSKTKIALSFTNAGENNIEHPVEHQGELVVIPATRQLLVRISTGSDAPCEFALTYLQLSYSPDEVVIPLPADDPVIFPNWDRIYQPAHLSAMERLRALHYRALTTPTPMPWHRNLRIMLHPHDGLSGILAISGFYEPHELMVLKKLLQAGDTFIDCGANIGLYSLYAASLVGQTGTVLAFEPSPREMTRLQENITLNRLTNITCFTCALSDHEVTAQFNIAQGAGENTLAETFGYTDTHLTERITVHLKPLDKIVLEQNIINIRLIKIDVEGAELHVLRGAAQLIAQMRPAILLEVFPAALLRMHATVTDIDMLLKDAGYRLHAIDAVTAQWHPLDNLSAIHRCTNILALPK